MHCNTVGADSTVSDSCNQQSTNNVNNGVPTAGKPGTTTLLVKTCNLPDPICVQLSFMIVIAGNNPQPSSFSLRGGDSQLVTLDAGNFVITSFSPTRNNVFSGDCIQTNRFQATGTISAGQHLTCTILI